MPPLRILYMATVGLSSCICGTYLQKWRNNSFKIEAQKKPLGAIREQPVSPDNRGVDLIKRNSYVISYDHRTRVPNFILEHIKCENVQTYENMLQDKSMQTAENLTDENVNVDANFCGCSNFFFDKEIRKNFLKQESDFDNSRYDKSFLVPLRIHSNDSKEFCRISNLVPQVKNIKQLWKDLNCLVMDMAKKYSDVYVCTGTIFKSDCESGGRRFMRYEVIGKNQVAVPTFFFKVIYAVNKTAGITDPSDLRDCQILYFKVKNSSSVTGGIECCKVDRDDLELATGLKLEPRTLMTLFDEKKN